MKLGYLQKIVIFLFVFNTILFGQTNSQQSSGYGASLPYNNAYPLSSTKEPTPSELDSLKQLYFNASQQRQKTDNQLKTGLDIIKQPVNNAKKTFEDTASINFFNESIDSAKIIESKIDTEEVDELKQLKKYQTRIPTKKINPKPFGFNYFDEKNKPSAIEDYGPVDPDYVLGVGDEIIIIVWGDVEFNQSTVVNRIGTISVKGIGQVSVAGLRISVLKQTLISRLSKVYSSIRNGSPDATAFADVTLGKLRTKKIYIIGDVKYPGAYNVSSMSTVLPALIYAGGPIENASLRDILVKRDGKTIKSVDCYDYFINGDKTSDIPLNDYDIIVVPKAQKRITITGAVHRQAIYELKPTENFKELLNFCGGFEPEAYTKTINIIRTFKNRERKLITLQNPYETVASQGNIELFDNDIISIATIDEKNNSVYIEGSVQRPGEYEYSEDLTIQKLMVLAGGVTPDVFTGRAEIFRTHEDYHAEVLAFDLATLLKGDKSLDIQLQKWDIIKIFSIWDMKSKPYIVIKGEVKNPGKYLLRQGMTIQDLVLLAGGFTKYAYTDTIEISRIQNSRDSISDSATIFRISCDTAFLTYNSNSNTPLVHMDNIFVRRNPSIKDQEIIKLTGEFNYPGEYAKQHRNESLSSLLNRAGGIKPSGYLDGAHFTRTKNKVGSIAIDLKKLIHSNSSKNDIILEDGDELFIPTEPKTVRVCGAVGLETSVKYENGKSIGYYIAKAGGYSSRADKRHVYVVLANGQVQENGGFWGTMINAGSEIYVPLKPTEQKTNWFEITKDMLSVISAVLSIYILAEAVKK